MFAIRYQLVLSLTTVLIFFSKWGLFYVTSSVSVLSDAMEGFVNLLAISLSLFSIRFSLIPKDRTHPYGHGKIEFVAAAMEGILLGCVGLWLIYQSINTFIEARAIFNLDYGIVGLLLIAVIQMAVGMWGYRYGKKENQIVIVSSSQHMKLDACTSLLLGGGLIVMYFTGLVWIDAFLALAMSIWILIHAYKMLRLALGGIMDESDESLLNEIIQFLNEHRRDCWIDLHNFRVIKFGSVLHLDCHLTLPWYWSIEQAHDELSDLTNLIQNVYKVKVEMFIHTDPCLPQSCTICKLDVCEHRKNPFHQQLKWTIDNVVKDQKHVI